MNDLTLTIKGLFGHFDYEIPLYGLGELNGLTMSDGVTILTGPNGYGKSTILRTLEAISKGDFKFFRKLKFQEISLRQDVGKNNIFISRKGGDLLINGENLPTLPAGNSALPQAKAARQYSNQVKRLRKYGARILPNTFMISEQRLLEIQDIPLTYDGKPVEVSGVPVMTQKVSPTVARLSSKLQSHFSAASDTYSEVDKELSGTFPFRVMNQRSADNLTKEEFDRYYQDMSAKLHALWENGLSNFAQQDIPAFQAKKSVGLRVFFDDFNKKYKSYEPLIKRLNLFREILNRRFKNFKRVEISRDGLRVFDIPSNKNGKEVEISLDKLSSGEQETLVLYYQLIFETAPGTMLLIDEPEISLHIAWQRTFIDELKEIVRLNQLRAVVATHSVSILNGNWDIEVSFGELYKNGREK